MSDKEELIKIFGQGSVLDDPIILVQYSRDHSFVHSIKPQLVVKPKNADEVLEIIKWANKGNTPLLPVSSGPPHFRGDTVPSTGGVIIVDLSCMKRIINVDRRNRVAMIEPGVTFEELQAEIDKEGLRINIPLLPRTQKSIVGSMLEREPVIMPKYQWDIIDPLACTGVVFGNGEIYRTGSAAGPGTVEEQRKSGGAQKSHADPLNDWGRIIQGSQGTMGIVTWATLRCELAAKAEEPFLAGSSNIDAILEFIHWLIRLRLANECFVLNNSNLARIAAMKWPEDYNSLRNSLPHWVLFFCMGGYDYFPEERLAYQKREMLGAARRSGVEPVKVLGGISAPQILKILRMPSEEPYWKIRGKGSCSEIFFLITYDKQSELISLVQNIAQEYDYPVSDMGIYLQPIVQGTSYHCEFDLFFNPEDSGEIDNVRKLSIHAVQALMNRGAFFSRPYNVWVDMVYRRDTETTIALRKVKKILDPNNIMNPGKLCF